MTVEQLRLEQITSADDPRLAGLSALMNATFPDPNTVLGLDRMQEFLAANTPQAARIFRVVVAIDPQRGSNPVVGGSVFSYVVKSNCGFSEYILADPSVRGRGIGRQLFDLRKSILDTAARQHGHERCHGLFIEVDNPQRTPADFAEMERETSLEVFERLRLFDHLGFRRVDAPYLQPPLAPGKEAIDYMDLLFAPWDATAAERGQIPAEWLFDTVEAIWSAWTPETYAHNLEVLKRRVVGNVIKLERAV